MRPFILKHADNERGVTDALQSAKSKIVAGGTNLIDLMKMYVEQPEELVDISDLHLNNIQMLPGGLTRIGALVSNSDLAYHPDILQRFPVLSQAILSGASPQLRNMATTGGNILQRTRCPYFFNTSFPCNKREPGMGCSALKGYNRSHAILGTSEHCIAAHPSDMCVALAALDAQVVIWGKGGERKVPFNSFHLLPGSTPEKENVLAADDLITSVELPAMPFANNSTYLKVRDRASYAFALTSAAVALEVEDGTIRNSRVALGGVGTKPWRSIEAEKILTGAVNSVSIYEKAADAALAGAKPYQYNAFKIQLAKRTLVRALKITGGKS